MDTIDYKEINNFFRKTNRLLDELYPEKIEENILNKCSFFIWEKHFFSCYLKEVLFPSVIKFKDIIGIDKIKETIFSNTVQFVKNFPANNVLLWGEKGCGKSSLIKSLIYEFKKYNLKLIEVGNNNLDTLNELFDTIAKFENFKFIIFLDDISFNEQNKNFKNLKAILDGSLIENKNNFLIYATSNRRHLVKEKFDSNDEIHKFEAISETISLSDRFGISLGIYKPEKDIFLQIAKHYAGNFHLSEFFDVQEALNFAMSKGGFSGRTAYQYAITLFKNKIIEK